MRTKSKLFILIMFVSGILFSDLAFAQCPDSIHLSRQSQVDSFFILYPDCRNAKIMVVSGDDITHLSGMLGIKTIDSFLIDNNPKLNSLHGLDSLVTCKKKLRINNNDALEKLTGLESFTGPTWTVHIVANLRLKNLKGLDNLVDAISVHVHYCDSITSLDGLQSLGPETGIIVGVTPLLTSLKGLENLTSVSTLSLSFTGLKSLDELSNLKQCGGVPYNGSFYYGGLGISYNDSLQSLHGLHNVITAGFIYIENNPLLKSLDGLNSLGYCHALEISKNSGLKTLEGLENLQFITGPYQFYHHKLVIEKNDSLQSIRALENLETVYSIRLASNPLLSDCAISYLCQVLTTSDPHVIVYNNNTGCDSIPEVLKECGIQNNYVHGRVFADLNCNMMQDSAENGLPFQMLMSSNGTLPFTMTNSAGEYFNYFLEDTLTIAPKARNFFSFSPDSYTVTSDTADLHFDHLDFAFCPDTLFHDLAVSISSYAPPRPGFTSNIQVCAQNIGTYIESGIMTLDFGNFDGSELISVVSAEGNGIISGKTVTWYLDHIPAFDQICFDVTILLSVDAQLSTQASFELKINSDQQVTEVTLHNNQVVFNQIILGSYDPNDKTVNRSIITPENGDNPLEYTIRFQNTGTYYATFVDIVDTIAYGLDLRTFELIACSHPCVITFPDTNVIRWRFDNILLPDSTHNELLSHGFVKFRINALEGLEVKRKIENKASIYFDYNVPVITNAATTIIRGQCFDDFYFTKQSQIDSFALLYPECDSLLSLYISGNDIDDLSPLNNIRSVSENVTIVNNPLLFDLHGLENLEYGGTLFEIEDNLNLLSLEGLNSLATVNGFLDIAYNPRLKSLEGLEKLTAVSGLEIRANDSLINLNGLDGITTDAWIYIFDNPKLASLTGLRNMTSAGFLVITNNDALLNLNGLENVRYLGELILDDNALLESITGFEKLQTIDYGIAILNNYDLTKCAIDFFCDRLFHTFLEYQIIYNGPACSSLDEILASCTITSLNEIESLENISVFPNPSTGSFYLQFDSKENFRGDIELLDQSGTVLLTEKFDAVTGNRFIKRFDWRSYSSGVYFLKLVTAEGITTKKMFLAKK